MLQSLRNRRALLGWLLSALTEAAVVIPWLFLLYAADGGATWPEAIPGAWLMLLVYLAAGLWEAGDRGGAAHGRVVALVAGTFLAYLVAYQFVPAGERSGLLRWNRGVMFAPVAAYLWYQGARSAIEGIDYGRAFSRFGYQFAALLGGLLLLMASGQADEPRVMLLLYWSVILFFAAGLWLLLVTRERALRADQAEMGEEVGGSTSSPVSTAAVFGLTLLTLAAAQLLSVERLLSGVRAVADFVSPVASWLWQVAMLILVRWVMLVTPLVQLAQRRKGQLPSGLQQGDPVEAEPPAVSDPGPGFDWTPYLRAALLVAVIATLAVWLYRLNRRQQAAGDEGEERVSLGFWRSLWSDLRSLLAQRRLLRATAAGPAVEGVDPRGARGLFRRLQAWGADRGRPRGEAETPNRFSLALAEIHPEAALTAQRVAAVYNQARYGGESPDPTAVAEARRQMEDLERYA